jgi:hypothetical protein
MRLAVFENNDPTLQATSEATCRLVTSLEILEAIGKDFSEATKRIRGDLMLLSTCGKAANNPCLTKDKRGFAAISELSLAQLAAVAYDDIDTLTEVTLNTTQDLFVQSAGGFDGTQYQLAPHLSPR